MNPNIGKTAYTYCCGQKKSWPVYFWVYRSARSRSILAHDYGRETAANTGRPRGEASFPSGPACRKPTRQCNEGRNPVKRQSPRRKIEYVSVLSRGKIHGKYDPRLFCFSREKAGFQPGLWLCGLVGLVKLSLLQNQSIVKTASNAQQPEKKVPTVIHGPTFTHQRGEPCCSEGWNGR